jgi:hypothetical protein
MLVVMQMHRLFVDVGLQCVVGIRQRGDFESHSFSSSEKGCFRGETRQRLINSKHIDDANASAAIRNFNEWQKQEPIDFDCEGSESVNANRN